LGKSSEKLDGWLNQQQGSIPSLCKQELMARQLGLVDGHGLADEFKFLNLILHVAR